MAAGSGRWILLRRLVVLDMARVGTDLKGVAAFHAGLGAAGAPRSQAR